MHSDNHSADVSHPAIFSKMERTGVRNVHEAFGVLFIFSSHSRLLHFFRRSIGPPGSERERKRSVILVRDYP